MKRLLIDLIAITVITLVVFAMIHAEARGVPWGVRFLTQYEGEYYDGKPTSKKMCTAKLASFADRHPDLLAEKMVQELAKTNPGKAFYAMLSEWMDEEAGREVNQLMKAGWIENASYQGAPTLPGEIITDATVPIGQ